MTSDPKITPPAGPRTVMVVEDEEGVRDLVAEVLEGSGFRVIQASNGREAIRLAEQEAVIDLVVTDVVMPGMSGFELSRWFAAQRPKTRLIFMTGYTDERTINREALDPRTILMQKPFAPASLLRIINAVFP